MGREDKPAESILVQAESSDGPRSLHNHVTLGTALESRKVKKCF